MRGEGGLSSISLATLISQVSAAGAAIRKRCTDAEWALIEPKGKPRKTPGRQASAIESDATLGTALELMVSGDC